MRIIGRLLVLVATTTTATAIASSIVGCETTGSAAKSQPPAIQVDLSRFAGGGHADASGAHTVETIAVTPPANQPANQKTPTPHASKPSADVMTADAIEPIAIDPPAAARSSQTHTVRQGDTLWDLAKHFYNDGQRWRDIAAANQIDNPGKLRVGSVITIP